MANTAKKIINRFYPPRNMLFYLQRNVLKPASRQRISHLIAGRLQQHSPGTHGSPAANYQQALDREGYVMLPNLLSPAQIADVFAFIQDKKCKDRWRPQNGLFHVSQAPETCHTADYEKETLMNCPHLLEAANNPLVLEVVSEILGCKPTISSMNFWWSLSGHDSAEEAENFHRDVDEWHFIKLFIYLTDVTEQSGPHVFVKGSQRESKLLPIRRYTDEEVEHAFGADRIMTFTGAAGTNFLENTFGFHKGQLPKTGNRLVFQSQYSLLPIHLYKYQPVKIDAERTRDFDPYINRLYIDHHSR